MKITLVRRWFGDTKTIGKILINGIFCYYALEDVIRPNGVKIYGQTAIPYGKYNVSVSHSQKLGRTLPLIENVPNFSGIRIHAGVDESWTEGCILISRYLKDGKLVKDSPSETAITTLIQNALNKNETVEFSIVNHQKRVLVISAIVLMALFVLFLTSKFFF